MRFGVRTQIRQGRTAMLAANMRLRLLDPAAKVALACATQASADAVLSFLTPEERARVRVILTPETQKAPPPPQKKGESGAE